MYESLFEWEMAISEIFPALSPLSIRKEKGGEVFLLMRRLARHNEEENKKYIIKNGERYKLKPATNWF